MKLESAKTIINMITLSIEEQLKTKYEEVEFHKLITNKVVLVNEKKARLTQSITKSDDFKKYIFSKKNIDQFIQEYTFDQHIEDDTVIITVKENKWMNVHFEFESTESGALFTSGDEYLWEFTERWIYFLGFPILRLYFNAENLGLFVLK